MENKVKYKRQLVTFADELFRYLFLKRINVENFCPTVRDSDNPTPSFDPIIGLAMLCESHRRQREYFEYFTKEISVIIKDDKCFKFDSFSTFCFNANDHFNGEIKNTCEKILNVGSFLLELSVFCSLLGHKQIKYFSTIYFCDVVYNRMGLKCFNRDNWNELIHFACEYFKAYSEEHSEMCVDQNNRTDIKTENLREYDMWVILLSKRILQGGCLQDKVPTRRPYIPNIFKENRIQQTDMLQRFVKAVWDSPDSSILKLVNTVKADENTLKLLNDELYIQIVVETLKSSRCQMSSSELLQLTKFVLKDNEALAKFCFLAIQYARNCRSEEDALGIISNFSTEICVDDHRSPIVSSFSNSNVKSSRESGAISKVISGKCAGNAITKGRIFREFKRVVEQNKDKSSREILKYFKDKPNSSLLGDEVFRKVMELKVKCSENLWENSFILSMMKCLDNTCEATSLKPDYSVLKNHPMVNCKLFANSLLEEMLIKAEKFDSPTQNSQYDRAQKPKVKEIGERISVSSKTTKDICENFSKGIVECRSEFKENILTADEKEKEYSRNNIHLPEEINIETQIVSFHKTDALPYKLSENKSKSVKVINPSSTEESFQNEQVLSSYKYEQVDVPENIKSTDLSRFNDFNRKFFDTSNVYNFCSECENFSSLIKTTPQIRCYTDIALKLPNISIKDVEAANKIPKSFENKIEKANPHTSKLTLSTLNKMDVFGKTLPCKKAIQSINKKLDKIEAKASSDANLINTKIKMREEFSYSQGFDGNSTEIDSLIDGQSSSSTDQKAIVNIERNDKVGVNSDDLIKKLSTDISEEILSNTKSSNMKYSMTKLKTDQDENTTQNLDIKDEEFKEIGNKFEITNPIVKVPKKFSYLQNCVGILPDSILQGENSFAVSQPLCRSDANHPDDVLLAEQKNNNPEIHYIQNTETSIDILSTCKRVMDSMYLKYSNEVLNGVLRQIEQTNPDLLKILKVKFILDKHIERKLHRFYKNNKEKNLK